MPDLSVVDELRAYLIAEGVVQAQDAAPSEVLPSLWIMPADGGAPAPRDGESMTVTLRDTNLAPAGALEAWITEAFIDVIVRSRTEPAGTFCQRAILGLIHPVSSHGGRLNWMMNDLLVEYSTSWRGDQPLPPATSRAFGQASAVTVDATFDRIQSFRFGCRRKALAGQPLTP